ncbi:hypothetical protein IAD21_06394 (plasmid) [Abditibacteriota bacterium]|nr:hypothetical protein IAD21_06394 [Abditibacteriota bacterium]
MSETKEFLAPLVPYVVALTCEARFETVSMGTRVQYEVASGFIVEVDSAWYWVTAAHVFSEYFKTRFDNGWRFSHWQFMAGENQERSLIPFEFTNFDDGNNQFTLNTHGLVVQFQDDLVIEQGIDYAYFRLSEEVRSELELAGAKALTNEHWGVEIDHSEEGKVDYQLLGYAKELAQDSLEEREIRATLLRIQVTRTDRTTNPQVEGSRPYLFEGQHFNFRDVDDDFKTINGLSGGPIFRVWRDLDDRVCLTIEAIFTKSGNYSMRMQGFKIKPVIGSIRTNYPVASI